MPLSAMWWKKPEYPERITDHGQATDQLYHLRLKSSAPFFVIYKAGREPTGVGIPGYDDCQLLYFKEDL
jgi:hypothetical protein